MAYVAAWAMQPVGSQSGGHALVVFARPRSDAGGRLAATEKKRRGGARLTGGRSGRRRSSGGRRWAQGRVRRLLLLL
jgi:hypothetical protein